MDPVSRAQSNDSSAGYSDLQKKRMKNLKPWPKGVSGNPSGRPKSRHITMSYEKYLRSPKGQKEIQNVFRDILSKRGMAAVLLLREMAERTEGKVPQEIDMTAEINTMSDDDLNERLAKLLAEQK